MEHMSLNKLRRAIRDMVNEVNLRRWEYQTTSEEQGAITNPIYDEQFSKLHKQGLFGYLKTTDEIRPLLYSLKGEKLSRTALENEYQEIKDFLERDIYTPKGEKAWDDYGRKRYEGFLRNANLNEGDFTEDDYSQFYSIFNKLKENAKSYGYSSEGRNADSAQAYVNAYLHTPKAMRESFGDMVAEAYSNLKNRNDVVNYKNIIQEFTDMVNKRKR